MDRDDPSRRKGGAAWRSLAASFRVGLAAPRVGLAARWVAGYPVSSNTGASRGTPKVEGLEGDFASSFPIRGDTGWHSRRICQRSGPVK